MSNFLPWQAAYSELVFLLLLLAGLHARTSCRCAPPICRPRKALRRRSGAGPGAGRSIVNAGGTARQMSNLQLRIISSVVLIVAVLAVTYVGGVAFRLLSAAIAGAMFYEWCAMSRTADQRTIPAGRCRAARRGASGARARIFGGRHPHSARPVRPCRFLDSRIGGQGSWVPAGLAYAGLSGVSLAFLRDGDQAGLIAILFLFAVVWATDIAAYFVGRSLGGPKLAPAISPGKTQSGAIGGTVGGVLAGIVFAGFAGLSNFPMLALVALLAFDRLAGRRPIRILGQTASRRKGFGHISFPAMAASWTGSTGLSRRPLPYTPSA